jgi:putative Mn2+ efflux pump MntP
MIRRFGETDGTTAARRPTGCGRAILARLAGDTRMFGATSLALALSLSMDSFAAALGRGAAYKKPGLPEALRVGVIFGVCQLLMSVAGWAVGSSFAGVVQAYDHWIAFGLLLAIGGSMLRNAVAGEADDPAAAKRSGWLSLLTTGLAMADVNIALTASLVGIVTFMMGFGGVMLGRAAGPMLGRRAELVGGLGLIAVGTKILVEHTLF